MKRSWIVEHVIACSTIQDLFLEATGSAFSHCGRLGVVVSVKRDAAGIGASDPPVVARPW